MIVCRIRCSLPELYDDAGDGADPDARRGAPEERAACGVCVVPAVGHKGFYCLRLFLSVRIVRETEKPRNAGGMGKPEKERERAGTGTRPSS